MESRRACDISPKSILSKPRSSCVRVREAKFWQSPIWVRLRLLGASRSQKLSLYIPVRNLLVIYSVVTAKITYLPPIINFPLDHSAGHLRLL